MKFNLRVIKPMDNCTQNCQHCLHSYTGVIHMVIPDGHVVLKCCKCQHTELQHRDHWLAQAHRWLGVNCKDH